MGKRKVADRELIKRISSAKPYEYLAEQLREAILSGDIAEGEALPPERELVERSGLSRSSVREALKVLAVEGFIEVRLGRFGGNIVTLPGRKDVASAIEKFVKGQRFPLRQLQEAREALEPALARLAALHRTENDVVKLKSLHEELVSSTGNFRAFAKCNTDWHNAVAMASGNDLLATMLYSISYGVSVSTFTEEYDTPEIRQKVIRVHWRITEAIEAGNAEEAGRLMARHVSATHALGRAPSSSSVQMSEGK